VAKLQGLQRQLETRELDVFENSRQIQALTADFNTEKQVLSGKLRALYKANRGISGLELVLSSGSFTEALDRIASLQLVVKQDVAGIRELEEKNEEIRIRTRLIEAQRGEIERLQEQREVVKSELEARFEEQNDLIARVEAEAGALESDVDAFRGEQDAISAKITDLRFQKRLELERLERQRQLEEARRRAAAASASGGYIWPLTGLITAEYGGCTFGQCPHVGIDIAAPLATPIVAATDGVVLHSGYAFAGDRRASYGMLVILAHSDTEETLYAHLADITLPPPVFAGQLVARGQVIGYVGLSGWTSGPHLHFEYRVNGQQVNPRNILR
jgi:murein DD-endopeptidase MepM/ murein hydrolase activator NlpD